MSISTTSRKSGPHPGNGVARTFSFNFKVFDETELRVSVTSAAGLEQVLPLNISYTVALNPDQDADAGGTITLSSPLAAGNRLVILSNILALQTIDMTNQGGFYPETVNEGLDRVTALVQQFDEKLGRAVTVPPSFEGGDLQLPEPKPGQIVAWGDDNQLSNLDPSGLVTVVAYGNSVSDIFDGDGSTTVFELSASPGRVNNMRLSVAGIVQIPGVDFEWGGGQVLTFYDPPPAGTKILAQFQEALPEFGSAQSDLSNVDPNIGRAALEAAKDDLSNVSASAIESKGFAKNDLSNVLASAVYQKSGVIVQYIEGALRALPQGRRIDTRFRVHLSDYGVSLYEADGVTIKDNTVAIQQAIDDVQAANGILVMDNFGARFRSSMVLTGQVEVRSGVHNGIDYTGRGICIIGESRGDRTAWQNGRYDLGQGLKMKAGGTGAVIKVRDGAGICVFEDFMISGAGEDCRGIEFEDRVLGSTYYSYGGHMAHVYVNGCGKSGMYIGQARARGTANWCWVEFCGTTSTEAAWAQLAYDWEIYSAGIGVNQNAGLYCGNCSQVRFIGGASWMNGVGVQVASDAMDIDFTNFHFDNSQRQNIIVFGYNSVGTRIGGRRFTACRTSGASQQAHNTYDDIQYINVPDGDTVFNGHDYMGGNGGEANLPRYLINLDANSFFRCDGIFVNTDSQKPYATDITNAWGRIHSSGGTRDAFRRMSNGGQGLQDVVGGSVAAEYRAGRTSIGGAHGAAPFCAEKVNGGSTNRLMVQSTGAEFDFVMLVAQSDKPSCSIDLVPKGPDGYMRFGKYTAGAPTADGYIRIQLEDGSFARLLVDKE